MRAKLGNHCKCWSDHCLDWQKEEECAPDVEFLSSCKAGWTGYSTMLGRRLVASKWLGGVGEETECKCWTRRVDDAKSVRSVSLLLRLLVSTIIPVAAGSASAVIPSGAFLIETHSLFCQVFSPSKVLGALDKLTSLIIRSHKYGLVLFSVYYCKNPPRLLMAFTVSNIT